MMASNYSDFVRAMASMKADGHEVDRVVLSSDSMNTFLIDGDFTEQDEEVHDNLGEFSVPIEEGSGDYIVSESGERVDL